MKVDNTIYETLGHTWWDPGAGFELTSLRYCVNPVRHGYFRKVLERLGRNGGAVLDVGCGGGFLSEAFAHDGFQVTGIDPAAASIAAAREHAARTGLEIRYQVGRGEELPFADASFDIAACCDVLEHVDDAGQVVGEIARVLKPGGLFLYDTVNRTRRSKLVLIKIWQDWDWGGFGAADAHIWDKFIKPAELAGMLDRHGFTPGEVTGMGPRHNPAVMICGLLRLRWGWLRGEAVAGPFAMRETGDLSVSYMGWALKPLPEAGPIRRYRPAPGPEAA